MSIHLIKTFQVGIQAPQLIWILCLERPAPGQPQNSIKISEDGMSAKWLILVPCSKIIFNSIKIFQDGTRVQLLKQMKCSAWLERLIKIFQIGIWLQLFPPPPGSLGGCSMVQLHSIKTNRFVTLFDCIVCSFLWVKITSDHHSCSLSLCVSVSSPPNSRMYTSIYYQCQCCSQDCCCWLHQPRMWNKLQLLYNTTWVWSH